MPSNFCCSLFTTRPGNLCVYIKTFSVLLLTCFINCWFCSVCLASSVRLYTFRCPDRDLFGIRLWFRVFGLFVVFFAALAQKMLAFLLECVAQVFHAGVRTFVRTFCLHGAMVNRSLLRIFFPESVCRSVCVIFCSRRSVCRILLSTGGACDWRYSYCCASSKRILIALVTKLNR